MEGHGEVDVGGGHVGIEGESFWAGVGFGFGEFAGGAFDFVARLLRAAGLLGARRRERSMSSMAAGLLPAMWAIKPSMWRASWWLGLRVRIWR